MEPDELSATAAREPAPAGRFPQPVGARGVGWRRWVPGLQLLREYEAAWLPRDILAGLVLTTMLVPVGIAYAVASGVPGIYGLYATIVPLLAYAFFGPSRILVLGPDSALAPASSRSSHCSPPAARIARWSSRAEWPSCPGSCVWHGISRLGFVTELLSKPIRYGYMNGIAFTVLIGQLPKMSASLSRMADPRTRSRRSARHSRRPDQLGGVCRSGGTLA